MARFAIVGSVSRDQVVTLVSPLRAGTHLEARAVVERMGGGAANVGVPLVAAGHHVTLVSGVGDDPDGGRLLEELSAAGVDLTWIARMPGRSTRSVVLIDPDGERTVINLHRTSDGGPPVGLLSIGADAVYVRSRARDMAGVLAAVTGRALVVAHVPPTEDGERPAHVLVGSGSDLPSGALGEPWSFGCRIAGAPLRWIVITRGADGATAHTAGETIHVPAPSVAVRDTTGAGDAFAAGLLHALVSGVPMPRALHTAVAWGTASVTCDGSVLPASLVAELSGPPANPRSPIGR